MALLVRVNLPLSSAELIFKFYFSHKKQKQINFPRNTIASHIFGPDQDRSASKLFAKVISRRH